MSTHRIGSRGSDLALWQSRTVLAALGTERSADVVSELDPDEAVDVLQQLTQSDAADVLEEMLRALDRAKNPESPRDRPVALRGFSWIVSPYESGGVVIALELTLGAVVAGPFDVKESELSAAIARVMARPVHGTIM